MKEFLSRASIPSFDAASYIDSHASDVSDITNIAIAVSGGGNRALTNGAGTLKSL